MFLDSAPRARSKKLRRYEHVDLTREFELRTKRREAHKQERLDDLYAKHDKRAAEMRSMSVVVDEAALSGLSSAGEDEEKTLARVKV
jgi:hypothetical protein